MKKLIFSSVAMLFLAGCAGVTVKRVTDRQSQEGVRYWRPAPYLALEPVTTGKTVTCNVKLIMLPDKSEEYAITFTPGWGTAEASPTLADGWNLTSMTGKADSKTAENITAIASLINTLPNLKTVWEGDSWKPRAQAEVERVVSPRCEGLFKVVYDPQTGYFSHLAKVELPTGSVVRTYEKPERPQTPALPPKPSSNSGKPPS